MLPCDAAVDDDATASSIPPSAASAASAASVASRVVREGGISPLLPSSRAIRAGHRLAERARASAVGEPFLLFPPSFGRSRGRETNGDRG